jgi:hypothetical protein
MVFPPSRFPLIFSLPEVYYHIPPVSENHALPITSILYNAGYVYIFPYGSSGSSGSFGSFGALGTFDPSDLSKTRKDSHPMCLLKLGVPDGGRT